MLQSVADIADIVRTGSVAKIGSTNSFGDAQLEMDVKADQAVFHRLKESGKKHSLTRWLPIFGVKVERQHIWFYLSD
jgi:fructose-1,6-bisphosphatase